MTAVSVLRSRGVGPVWSCGWDLASAWAAVVWIVDFRSSRLQYEHGNGEVGKWLIQSQPRTMTPQCVEWSMDIPRFIQTNYN